MLRNKRVFAALNNDFCDQFRHPLRDRYEMKKF